MDGKKVVQFTRDDAYKILDTINYWTTSADSKATGILSFLGIFLTILFATETVEKIAERIRAIFVENEYFLGISVVFSLTVCVFGLILLLSVLTPKIINLPKTKKRHVCKSHGSVMFYGSIASLSYDEYVSKVKNICDMDDIILRDLLFQIHSAAIICDKKMKSLKYGIPLFFFGLILFVVLMTAF